MNVEFPDKLAFLFKPARYKCAYGGRGSGKSWGFARALLLEGAQKPLRVLCTREVQKSLADSVHKLLSDQIEAMGLSRFYEVQQTVIRGKNGTEFTFAGLQSHTVDSIKSYEGVDRVWVEEAHAVSKTSWNVLLPTIRKPGSEIWVTFNPQLDTDETYVRFVKSPPPDCISILMNYTDNPWFPDVLEAERVHAENTMKPEEYGHIWEGRCMPAVEGAIYFDEVAGAESKGRIREVPYDPLLKVHGVWDLGWNDSMSIILVQRSASEIRVIDYIEDSHRTLSDYAQDLKAKGLNWGNQYLPHDGYTKDFKTGKSAQEILAAMGLTVPGDTQNPGIPRMDIESGIKAAREVFPRIYFDKDKTGRLVECLKRYRRHINQQTREPGQPLHDAYSHGADAFRYLALVADQLSNDEWGGAIRYQKLSYA
ncbi:phage terminase large subunit [Acidovorax delafieldii]|uniref:Phage terminase large subunit n=1 Tax=Acidovorax delafieldii TaxID=47920 RepID=A0AAJ2C212_ACIDE|nr:PBSX family phage terminase large subunit [Acidovorax delafieldii]MDR6768625.1 phage terminase large subunit [Acidovorax delafieldii]MDR6837340.1 phage terminase large subunit [Acidovorax delafieldii]MDR7366831.1 phage terminase large subunit [Acidovorax delafieldii]